VGVAAIRRAVEEADVVVIDEIGPMELYSEEFKAAVAEALDSPKPVVATIHVRASRYPFGRAVLSRGDCTLLRLTLDNRSSAPLRIVEAVLRALGHR
ncbi:MAG: NTPase, partial [Thermoprotei archaeon]